MKVSVLIPVFNGERHLAECLDSILAQDFRDLEILISDDGSTDGSLEIVKGFAARDSRIRWWKNPCNLGLTANSNLCLKAVKGEYIKFVHQDDKLLSSSAIRKMVEALDAHPNASLAGSRQHFTRTDSACRKFVSGNHEPPPFFHRSGCFNGRQMIISCLEENYNIVGAPVLTLFRRFQAQRGFDERFTLLMDYEMWLHLLEQGDYAHLAEPLATWRVHSEQQSSQSAKYDHEELLLREIYYQKPWLQAAATQRMLFIQSCFLKKKYGPKAAGLVKQMRACLKPWNLLAFSIERKIKKIKRWTNKTINHSGSNLASPGNKKF